MAHKLGLGGHRTLQVFLPLAISVFQQEAAKLKICPGMVCVAGENFAEQWLRRGVVVEVEEHLGFVPQTLKGDGVGRHSLVD